MNSLNNNDDLNISSSEYNNRSKLEGQFDVLGSNSHYDIIAPKTFKAERYFGGNTEWCTVARKSKFSEYMEEGQLYILYPKNGDSKYKMQFHFEKEEFADKHNNVYDNPLECIESVIEDESVRNQIIALCKKVFPEKTDYFKPFEELVKSIITKLENGVNPKELFEYVFNFHEGFAIVYLRGKYNFINTENKILRPDLWFDNAGSYRDGIAMVYIEGEGYNFIKPDGNFLRDDLWFDEVGRFSEGIVRVTIKGGDYDIDSDGILYDDKGNRVDIPVQESKKYNNNTNNINNMKRNVIKLTESDLHRIIKESVKKILKEDFYDNMYNLHNFEHFNNDDDNNDYYTAYVVVNNGDGAVLSNYGENDLEDAIEEARELARTHKFSTFYVCGCDDKNEYSYDPDDEDNTIVYCTDEDC
jgi:hypothetical protein